MIYKEDLLEMRQVALAEKLRIEAEISVFDRLIERENQKEQATNEVAYAEQNVEENIVYEQNC